MAPPVPVDTTTPRNPFDFGTAPARSPSNRAGVSATASPNTATMPGAMRSPLSGRPLSGDYHNAFKNRGTPTRRAIPELPVLEDSSDSEPRPRMSPPSGSGASGPPNAPRVSPGANVAPVLMNRMSKYLTTDLSPAGSPVPSPVTLAQAAAGTVNSMPVSRRHVPFEPAFVPRDVPLEQSPPTSVSPPQKRVSPSASLPNGATGVKPVLSTSPPPRLLSTQVPALQLTPSPVAAPTALPAAAVAATAGATPAVTPAAPPTAIPTPAAAAPTASPTAGAAPTTTPPKKMTVSVTGLPGRASRYVSSSDVAPPPDADVTYSASMAGDYVNHRKGASPKRSPPVHAQVISEEAGSDDDAVAAPVRPTRGAGKAAPSFDAI